MTKTELALLLYFESRFVNHAGVLDLRHMNEEDFEIMSKWTEIGYIKSGRICSADIKKDTGGTMFVKLTMVAMKQAHKERIARSKRMQENRTWRSTIEFSEGG